MAMTQGTVASLIQELDLCPTRNNLKQLRQNVAQAAALTVRITTRLLVTQSNQALWKINGSITRLNGWIAARCERMKCDEKAEADLLNLRLQVERMENEGEAMMASAAPRGLKTIHERTGT